MKKFYKLDDIADFTNINNYFALVASPTLSEDETPPEYTIWNEAEFEDIFDQVSERSIYIKETPDAWAKFKAMYKQWSDRNKGFIANEVDALLKKYNPIENYNSTEIHSGTDTKTQTPDEWMTTKTETPDNYKETTTQTPTNWQKQNTKSYTNYHETETQTPTNWETESEKTYTDYHETETQTPTNWEKTDTQTPTNWSKTGTDSFTNYHETETQTPNGWTTDTTKMGTNNGGDVVNKVRPINAINAELVSETTSRNSENTSVEQKGTYSTDKTFAGTKAHTETQTGTYQTVSEQTGTYETDRTKTGTETDTVTQSGTYETDRTKTGTETDTEVQSGTYQTETAYTGSRSETVEQSGEMVEETDYGHQIKKFGNIGVTTTMQMIASVLDLYDKDFVYRWIMRFFDSVSVYV